jgi:hypothetical protein
MARRQREHQAGKTEERCRGASHGPSQSRFLPKLLFAMSLTKRGFVNQPRRIA